MTFDEFEALCSKRMAAVIEMRDTKGKEYAGKEDRLANFKRSAQRCGITPMQSWLVLFDKHVGSIENYIKSGGISYSTESIQGRITDAITYLLLFEGLVAENDASLAAKLKKGATKCPKNGPLVPKRDQKQPRLRRK